MSFYLEIILLREQLRMFHCFIVSVHIIFNVIAAIPLGEVSILNSFELFLEVIEFKEQLLIAEGLLIVLKLDFFSVCLELALKVFS
jgi:hypothetical protein